MRPPDIVIKRARWPADAEAIRSVRHLVFVTEQGIPESLEWDGTDATCLHLLAMTRGSIPVGTLRMQPDGHVGRLAVLASCRRQGIGGELLQTLIQIAAEQGQTTLFLNAQCTAIDFYTRFGFRPDGPVFQEAGIAHRRMVLTVQTVPESVH